MAGQEETNSRGRAKLSRRDLSKSVARAEFLAGERCVQKELAAVETLLSTSVPAQMDDLEARPNHVPGLAYRCILPIASINLTTALKRDPPDAVSPRTLMQAISRCVSGIVSTVIMSLASSVYAQDAQLSVPNVMVIAQAAPVEPPYMRDPWKSYARNPYFGRYRIEEDKFAQVPCAQTRIAFSAGGKCLQGYRLFLAEPTGWEGSPTCDLALDVVIDTTGKLSVEADILVFDPYKVVAGGGSPPRFCYVNGYLGYDQEDFQDMNQVTRRATSWHNLIIDEQDRQNRSIEFSDGPHHCVAVLKHGPIWLGGYMWIMHASICRTDAASVQPADIAYVLGSLQTRIYDPVGNLRNANDRTTYGPAAAPKPTQ